jgi:SsrA-binding protein
VAKGTAPAGDKGDKVVVATNRKAHHLYSLDDHWEAGLVLMGSEVKSLRNGNANLSDSYAQPQGDELWVYNLRIGEYKPATRFGHDPLRPRKLLLHRAQLDKILQKIKERGYTLIPTQLYFRNGVAKLEIALARGKSQIDRREDIKERETKREVDRAMRTRGRAPVPRGGRKGGGDYDD